MNCLAQGRPYMESLRENTVLLYSLMGAGGLVMSLAMGVVPEFAQQFEIVDFPAEVRNNACKHSSHYFLLKKSIFDNRVNGHNFTISE